MTIRKFSKNDYEIVEFHNNINERIQVYPMYFKLGFSSIAQVFGRAIVLKSLLQALKFLPQDYGFLIWDVYRPRSVQKTLFNWVREEIRLKLPALSEEENYEETKKYISPPSRVGEDYCPPHLSGGAIDLTLFEMTTNKELDMGTPFDESSERAHSNYFNLKTRLSAQEKHFKYRRNLLHTTMNHAGFTSYQYEWWHFDIGNLFWSRAVKQPAVFGPLFGDKEWPDDHE
ncbi:M15 family metallopeptidase [Legionella fairfieldensis]|uniref:M15 family metallopeptidase n=1 Tax=Legionella fairfieldensis TaxID=45064 RepID=UPI000A4AB29B|nr:M15 family metallopeptidase [Legionella fairfieldensis]